MQIVLTYEVKIQSTVIALRVVRHPVVVRHALLKVAVDFPGRVRFFQQKLHESREPPIDPTDQGLEAVGAFLHHQVLEGGDKSVGGKNNE